MDPCGNSGAKIPADSGCAHQKDLRLELVDDTSQRMSVRLCPIFLQFGIVHHDNPVSAILGQFVCQTLYAAAHQHCGNLRAQIVSQILALADQLEGYAVDGIVHLLGKDKYALIFL